MTEGDIRYLNKIDWAKLSRLKGYKSEWSHRDDGISHFYNHLAGRNHWYKPRRLVTKQEMLDRIIELNMKYDFIESGMEHKLVDEVITQGEHGFYQGWEIDPKIDRRDNSVVYHIWYNSGS